jgi:LAO/AO transport system kinase
LQKDFQMAISPYLVEKVPQRQKWDIEKLSEGIQNGDIATLSKAITLLESQLVEDIAFQKRLLQIIKPPSKSTKRIAISGIPGVGKSTFIESFGLEILTLEPDSKIAVLTIDPTSTVRNGSILGDKTRMSNLSNHTRAYVRPSPTSGNLGGVTLTTRKIISLCESAGFDNIIIETVGVGQTEIEAYYMTDCFVLFLLPNTGDDIQGIKKGIMEMADIIVINKSDLFSNSEYYSKEISQAVALSKTSGELGSWETPLIINSSNSRDGLIKFISLTKNFFSTSLTSGSFSNRRKNQLLQSFNDTLNFEIINRVKKNELFQKNKKTALMDIESGKLNLEQGLDFCLNFLLK